MCCSLPSNFQKHQHQLSWARRPKGCPVILEREIFYQEDTTTTTTTTPEGTKLWLFFFPYLGRITPDSRKESRVKYECLDENVTGKVVCQVRKFWFQSRQVCWNMTSTPFMMCWNWMFQWPSNQLSTSQVDTPFGGVMGSWVVVFRVFLLSSRLPPWKISLAQKCWSLIFGGRAGATEDGDMELRLPQGVGEALLVGWKNGYPPKNWHSNGTFTIFNRSFFFKWLFFQCHVSFPCFPGCITMTKEWFDNWSWMNILMFKCVYEKGEAPADRVGSYIYIHMYIYVHVFTFVLSTIHHIRYTTYHINFTKKHTIHINMELYTTY